MSDREPREGAAAWIIFAGFLMIINGGFSLLEGVGLVLRSDDFPGSDSILAQQSSTWSWTHIAVGAVLLLSGIFVFRGNVLARTVGVIAAALGAFGAFATIQFQPFWNLAIIAIDIAIIWALTVHGRDLARLDHRGV
jgi:hypothetical protein